MLGLSISTLARYSDAADTDAMLELAKRTPALLMYAPGEQRAEALLAAWPLRRRRDERAHRVEGEGAGYVRVGYVSVDVVPLVDYCTYFRPHFLVSTDADSHVLRRAAVCEGGVRGGGVAVRGVRGRPGGV